MERWEEKENREFFRAGTIAAAALNPWRGEDRKHNPFTPYDFFNIPRPPKAPAKLTPAELKANAKHVFSIVNARNARREARRKRRA